MRIVIHDFIGHPFQVQLSRELAARGHAVLHLHFPAFETPKGALERRESDSPGFQIDGLTISGGYDKYSFLRRHRQERRYTSTCVSRVLGFRPEIVLSGNAPPGIQSGILAACRRAGVPFIPWVQDFHGEAIGRLLGKRFGAVGRAVGLYFRWLDERVLRDCTRAVFIADDFLRLSRVENLERKANVIGNWAPIADLPPRPKANPWSTRHSLQHKFVFLYSGTLGMKHNPELLLGLARELRDKTDAVVVVASQGIGRDWLTARTRAEGLTNIQLIDFQPFAELADMMASADVLVAILEKEAGIFSVPSKILTYLCAERPILVAVPESNLAARIVKDSGAGIVTDPDRPEEFHAAARKMIVEPKLAALMAERGRRYAVEKFDIRSITDQFEEVFHLAVDAGASRHQAEACHAS